MDHLSVAEVIDENEKWINLEVTEPVTITSRENFGRSISITTYLIKIETNNFIFATSNSAVRRRYSDFLWLRSKLSEHSPNEPLPALPPKKYLHMFKFNPKVIEERRCGLEYFLERVLCHPVLLFDIALHLFIQSELSLVEMDKKLSETINSGGFESKVVPGTWASPNCILDACSFDSGDSESRSVSSNESNNGLNIGNTTPELVSSEFEDSLPNRGIKLRKIFR